MAPTKVLKVTQLPWHDLIKTYLLMCCYYKAKKKCSYPDYYRTWKQFHQEKRLPNAFQDYHLELPIDEKGMCLFPEYRTKVKM